jgi:polyphosphate kinase
MVVDTDLIEEELLIEHIDEDGDSTESDTNSGYEENTDTVDADDGEQMQSDGENPSIFDVYSEYWYRPDSEQYEWAVQTTDGGRRYFKTREGARNRLRSEYE